MRKMQMVLCKRVLIVKAIVLSIMPFVGKCIGYTRAVDNEPEIAEIDIDSGIPNACYGLMESEISDIEELKD